LKTLNLIQGDANWHAHRATSKNASDAPAMLGCSEYKTRSELLHEAFTGIRPEATPDLQRRFDDGHAIEEAQLPGAEEVIGEQLYPVVGCERFGDIELSASFDGLTLLEDTAYECKTLNEKLRAALPAPGPDGNDAAALPKMYRAQMEQQLMVCGGDRVLFTAATKDGTDVRRCWYSSDPALRAEILAGWKQFDADLKTYVPADVKEMPKPEVTVALPALFIQASGGITTSNMKEYGAALAARLAAVRSIALVNDQDFSNAKAGAALLRDEIKKAQVAKDAMLSQTVTVGEAARMIDAWCEDMRLTALQLEKDVEREDKAKKAAMIDTARRAYDAHIDAAKADTGGPWIALPVPDWAGAIKGKRNFASMQDALDGALAQGKMAADTSARNIRAALAALDESSKGFEHLFADRLSFISKTPEDVRMLARARVTEHEAAEKRRAEAAAEAAREAIRREEQAKAEKEAREKLAVEQAEAKRLADEQAARDAESARQAAAPASTPAPAPTVIGVIPAGTLVTHAVLNAAAAPAANVVPLSRPAAPQADTGARVKLGDINAAIAPLSITADGLAALGFPHIATEKAAKLYSLAALPAIYAAMVRHIEAVQAKAAA